MQRSLGRQISLDEASNLTVGKLKAMETQIKKAGTDKTSTLPKDKKVKNAEGAMQASEPVPIDKIGLENCHDALDTTSKGANDENKIAIDNRGKGKVRRAPLLPPPLPPFPFFPSLLSLLMDNI